MDGIEVIVGMDLDMLDIIDVLEDIVDIIEERVIMVDIMVSGFMCNPGYYQHGSDVLHTEQSWDPTVTFPPMTIVSRLLRPMFRLLRTASWPSVRLLAQ